MSNEAEPHLVDNLNECFLQKSVADPHVLTLYSYLNLYLLPCICWAGSSRVQWLGHPPSACGPWPVCTGLSSPLCAMVNCTGPYYEKSKERWWLGKDITLHSTYTTQWLDSVTHSSFRKSNVLDFSVGNWENVLLLFTRLPGALYFTLDWDSTFFIAGTLEEELNSLLKLQVTKLQRAKRGTEQTGVQGRSKVWGHQPTRQPRNHQHLL